MAITAEAKVLGRASPSGHAKLTGQMGLSAWHLLCSHSQHL